MIFHPSQNWSQEIRGLSFVGTLDRVSKEHLIPIKKSAANWVALMPYGYMKSAWTPLVSFNVLWQWRGETKNEIEQAVPFFGREGISVMLKPHIWIKGSYLQEQFDLTPQKSGSNFKNLTENSSCILLRLRKKQKSRCSVLEMNCSS